MLLSDKVLIVAGIGTGLGRSVALKATEEGAAVALVARSTAYATELAQDLSEMGRQAIAVQGDLTKAEDCARIAATTTAKLGGIDIVVYNAFSGGAEAPFEQSDLAEWREAMEINAFGALEIVQACLGSLKQRRGSVVLVNSRQIRRIGQPRGGYTISKAALHMAGQVLANELGPYGVRVNTVVSGWMWGPAVEGYFERAVAVTGKTVEEQYRAVADSFPLRRIPVPDEVADAVIYLASERASAITGQSLDVNAGESFH
jgi:NAD(P)-dependent dehydrogenase (short-subunit alcohol dehydrogenase family)